MVYGLVGAQLAHCHLCHAHVVARQEAVDFSSHIASCFIGKPKITTKNRKSVNGVVFFSIFRLKRHWLTNSLLSSVSGEACGVQIDGATRQRHRLHKL
jgi:hypothetical protein